MKLKRRPKNPALLAVIISSFFFTGWADNWDGIKDAAKSIKSISADFTQRKHMKILARPLVSNGRFSYAVPDSLRWEYISPVKSILLMHGGNIKRYNSSPEGYVEDSSVKLEAMRVVLQEITMWLNGRFDENPNFTAKLVHGKPARIILSPREAGGISTIIQRIELKLSLKPGIIDSVTIFESENAYTVIEFLNPGLNLVIPDSVFTKI